jgi:hypothetical protein
MSNDAGIYLDAKIVNFSSKHFADMGFLTTEEIQNKLMMGKFHRKEVGRAIQHCLKRGSLELYYKVHCPACDNYNHVLEEDYNTSKTYKEMVQKGTTCKHCGNYYKAGQPIVKLYAIPQKYLGSDEEDPERWGLSPLKRLIRMLTPFRRLNDE